MSFFCLKGNAEVDLDATHKEIPDAVEMPRDLQKFCKDKPLYVLKQHSGEFGNIFSAPDNLKPVIHYVTCYITLRNILRKMSHNIWPTL